MFHFFDWISTWKGMKCCSIKLEERDHKLPRSSSPNKEGEGGSEIQIKPTRENLLCSEFVFPREDFFVRGHSGRKEMCEFHSLIHPSCKFQVTSWAGGSPLPLLPHPLALSRRVSLWAV